MTAIFRAVTVTVTDNSSLPVVVEPNVAHCDVVNCVRDVQETIIVVLISKLGFYVMNVAAEDYYLVVVLVCIKFNVIDPDVLGRRSLYSN